VTIVALRRDTIKGNSLGTEALKQRAALSANKEKGRAMPANVMFVNVLFVVLVALAAAGRRAGR
jgi:hypothetical protein